MRTVKCIKLDKEAEGLDNPTYPGELGKKIYDNEIKNDAKKQNKLEDKHTLLFNLPEVLKS